MTKVFFYCIIVCFTTLCGYILTKKYRERKLFFNQFSHPHSQRFFPQYYSQASLRCRTEPPHRQPPEQDHQREVRLSGAG